MLVFIILGSPCGYVGCCRLGSGSSLTSQDDQSDVFHTDLLERIASNFSSSAEMIAGTFKFVLAVVMFFVVGIVVNPAIGSLFNGYQLPPLGVFLASLVAAGLVVGAGKK